MKKKYGLFKVLSVLLLVIVFVTYFVNDRQGTITYLALGDVVLNYLQSFYYFFDTALFILVVGGFYGVLNRIPAYKEMLKRIAKKMEAKRKGFVIAITIAMALVASLTGLDVLLLLVVPRVVSVILLLGYDKLVAISATIGSIVVGFIGGVFVTMKDPASYYSISYTTIDKFVGLDSHFANLLPKILLLIVGIGLLIWHIVSYIKKVEKKEVNYDLSSDDALFVEEKTSKKAKGEEEKKVRVWPLAVSLIVLFVLLVLGYLPWADLFGLDIFNKFHEWLLGLKIGNYAVVTSLVSSSLSQYGAFGTWGGLGNHMMAMFVVVIFAMILTLGVRIKRRSLGYGMKLGDVLDGFVDGVKKMIPAVMVVIL